MGQLVRSAAYLDPESSVEARIEDLLSRMTLPEKVGQLLMLDAQHGDLADIVSAKLAGSVLHVSPELMPQAMELAGRTRLGIPLLTADDGIHGHSFWPGATIFPTQLAMACTWDPSLLHRVARVAATEIAATGIHGTFSPVLCITRDLRWGRINETFGEDPFLIGELGAAMVRGYQGKGLSDPTAVLAYAKHFAGYSETMGGRDASEADLSPRKLRSWFLPPFEQAVRAGCRGFMLGYQSIDGVPITANQWLINDVLKGEWGFTGTLVTDWDNVGRMVYDQRTCADHVEAAAVAVNSGNDLIMATPQFFEGAQEAVARGLVEEKQIDDAVRRVLRLKFELGLFEDPRTPDPERQAQVIGCRTHADLNLETARRSLVLLRNEGILPFEGGLTSDGTGRAGGQGTPRTIAVIGPNADSPEAMLGDWAGATGQVPWMPEGHPRETVETVLDGLRAVAPADWTVTHARGADIASPAHAPEWSTGPDGQPLPPVFTPAPVDQAQLREAVAAAAAADYAVVVVGDSIALTGETRSTATLDLQGSQIALLDAVAATGTPVIVVLVQSKPSALPESALNAAALIEAFNPGMRGGRAIAELLLGLVEPSGRLPVSFARHVGQQPVFYNQVRGQHGERYADLTQDPLFAFGEGLTYTTVTYSDLVVHAPDVPVDGTVDATVRLTNSGSRPALETVQAYISDLTTSVTWAEQELKGFTQVSIPPGESLDVHLGIPAAQCSLVTADNRRVVEAGEFMLRVGPSSRREHQLSAGFRIRT
ncbi:glycoside hydrolase family 3 N-terminal domain-containing protein [Streptomyces europaeiscabiei]|uniref:glycoside hydrolase family 3 N-terminal domain-containing protein n=1 Tax=Streptomyces europaeiscabiei TaxID=146819 RepID=UPI0029B8F20B|nr:glycoside hydrolase family 3 N-terminal domain-containing protein [Streptomyces europaeiscabiei]MDX3614057.1 glycoside hydrolase family 3 N-terminal domain-containing protein [Streptomyces europaeiscabiei]